MQNMFVSPTLGSLTLDRVRDRVVEYITDVPECSYRIIIGSDSQPHNGSGVDFVTAIVVHREGRGGIYFWKRIVHKRHYVLRTRMYAEAMASLETAELIATLLKNDGIVNVDIEIHVDIGTKGETRDMITEIVGMIRGSGYNVKTKPDSFAASKVADRYT